MLELEEDLGDEEMRAWFELNGKPYARNTGRSKLIHGVGVNDSEHATAISYMLNGKLKSYKCEFHVLWECILRRCYQKNWLLRFPSYIGSEVCEDWKYFSRFKFWVQKQNRKFGNEILQLDKDILVPGSKLYSPETCVFVPQWLNKSLNVSERVHRTYPVGVTKKLDVFGKEYYFSNLISNFRITGSESAFSTPEEAHQMWQLNKAQVIENHLARYRLTSCYLKVVDEAMMLRVVKLREDSANGIETKFIL